MPKRKKKKKKKTPLWQEDEIRILPRSIRYEERDFIIEVTLSKLWRKASTENYHYEESKESRSVNIIMRSVYNDRTINVKNVDRSETFSKAILSSYVPTRYGSQSGYYTYTRTLVRHLWVPNFKIELGDKLRRWETSENEREREREITFVHDISD